MQLLKLRALSRLTWALAILCPVTSNLQMTNAAGPGSIEKEHYNDQSPISYFISPSKLVGESSLAQIETRHSYEPDFAGFDRSIMGRVSEDPEKLDNNIPMIRNIQQGKTDYWIFPKEQLLGPKSAASGTPLPFESDARNQSVNENSLGDLAVDDSSHNLLKRQDGSPESSILYVSLVICDQPLAKDQRPETGDQLSLTVHISQSSNEPNSKFVTSNGYGAKSIQSSGDVILGVEAAENPNFDGIYNYQLTASIDTLYAAAYVSAINDSKDYFMRVDSDSTSALFVSGNLSIDDTAVAKPPYSIFVYRKDDPKVVGLEQSFCGLQNHVQIKSDLLNGPSTANVDTQLVNLSENQWKQQFYVTGLNASSEYFAVLAVDGNSTSDGGNVRGGGTVGTPLPFITKSDQNCAILYNLSFCTDVAYAVPYNAHDSNLSNLTTLAALYDDNARALYRNFSLARQQIPCNTTPEAQYSQVRNCGHCDKAYKSWLCAVTIPRCEDFSSVNSWLQPRAVSQPFFNGSYSTTKAENRSSNSSRSWLIDEVIRPGPWKEILPCKELCYDLVQSCPASMGFVCPLIDQLKENYGSKGNDTNVRCNLPGDPWNFSNAPYTAVNKLFTCAILGVVLLINMEAENWLFAIYLR